MTRLIFSLGIITFGIVLGYVIQRLDRKGLITLPLPIDEFRKFLQKAALVYLTPFVIASAIWMVKLGSLRLLALPFLGALALGSGGFFALIAARALKLPPRKTGALFGCGSFTNLGSIGALVCFVFLGERGFALVPIYKLFEEVIYYGVGFPIARSYSGAAPDKGFIKRIVSLFSDPLVPCILSGIIAGFALNLSGVRRPEIFAVVNSILVPFTTLLLLVSIGLSLRLGRVKNYVRESSVAAAIKFVLVPVLVTAVAYLLGFQKIDNGMPLKVVIIMSSMPVAFNALLPPSLYDLDIDLANSCWLVTTSLLVVVLPILLFIISSF